MKKIHKSFQRSIELEEETKISLYIKRNKNLAYLEKIWPN